MRTYVLRQVGGVATDGLPQGFERWEFTVEGVTREALVYIPPSVRERSSPVVFVFHGRGGTSQGAARLFAMDRHWPEAISVYMQGLNTPVRVTDPPGNRPGWQRKLDEQENRDLKFFDAVLERLNRDYKVEDIYATGHSNGGAFTYLLWAERGEVLSAVAPSSGFSNESLRKLKPKPAMHIAGENDPLVKFEWQKRAIERVREVNGCGAEGKPWDQGCTIYSCQPDTPLVTLIHAGRHQLPVKAPGLIANFFKGVHAKSRREVEMLNP